MMTMSLLKPGWSNATEHPGFNIHAILSHADIDRGVELIALSSKVGQHLSEHHPGINGFLSFREEWVTA